MRNVKELVLQDWLPFDSIHFISRNGELVQIIVESLGQSRTSPEKEFIRYLIICEVLSKMDCRHNFFQLET